MSGYSKLNDWEVRPKQSSYTPIFDAVLADSDPDIFLAGNIFPRPGLLADWVREALDMELAPWQRDYMDARYRSKVLGDFRLPAADKGHRVMRGQAFMRAGSDW